MSHITKKAAHYLKVAQFLTTFESLLTESDYETQEQAARDLSPDGEYEYIKNLTYASFYVNSFSFGVSVHGPGSKLLMTRLRRGIGGKWSERASGETLTIHSDWNDLRVEISSSRGAVCTPKVIGTEEKVVPAQEAIEAVPEHTETVIKVSSHNNWSCKHTPNQQLARQDLGLGGSDPLPSDVARTEQTVIDWLADLNQHYTRATDSAKNGQEKTREHVSRLLYFATGREHEVREVIPMPTHSRRPHNQQGRS